MQLTFKDVQLMLKHFFDIKKMEKSSSSIYRDVHDLGDIDGSHIDILLYFLSFMPTKKKLLLNLISNFLIVLSNIDHWRSLT